MIISVMQSLLDCAEQKMAEAGRPAFGRVFLNPGNEAPWDDCCSGQLWVRAGTMFPVNPVQGNCGVTDFTTSLYLGSLRCAHTVDDNGTAPTAAEMTGDATAEVDEAEILLDAIRCCFNNLGKKIVVWTPLGVEGGCVGGEWQVDVRVLLECQCE